MPKFPLWLLAAAIAAFAVRAADWPSQSGNPQRDGWARAEKSFTKENAGKIELLYKHKADNQSRGMHALTSPLVVGNLITYLGFKEMLVFGGSSDNVFSVDADLNRLIWKNHFVYKGDKPQAGATNTCPGGITTPVTMPGSSNPPTGRGGGRGRAGTQPQPVNARPVTPPNPRQALFTPGFGRAGVFVLVTGDGYLHLLNTSTGADKIDPIRFVPANAKVSALNIDAGTIYASTVDNCGGSPNGLYAIDMLAEGVEVRSFLTNGAGLAGWGGTAISLEGTVYAQASDGRGEVAGDYRDTVLALSPKELKVKDFFTPHDAGASRKLRGATPVVFTWKGKEIVAAGSQNGSLYLLDAASLGGADHHTPLFATSAGAAAPESFATWEDTTQSYGAAPSTGPGIESRDSQPVRWLYATLPDKIVGYKVEDRGGKPALTQAWESRALISPAPPATANGLVFALSGGDRQHPAVLYALDGATGKELYSSGNAAATYSHGSGLAVANGRIYFTTHDNTVLCFGFLAEQPQLTGR